MTAPRQSAMQSDLGYIEERHRIRQLKRLAAGARRTQLDRDIAIRDAARELSHQQIAEAVGLTRQRVGQIVKGAGS